MTLLERAVALRQDAERYHQFERREDLARRLRERTGELERYIKEIEGAKARLVILSVVSSSIVMPPSTSLARACDVYRKIIVDMDPKAGPTDDDGTTSWKPIKQTGKVYLDKLDKLVKEAIGEQKNATLGVISAADIEGLRSVPGAEATATSLAALRLELSTTDWLAAIPARLQQLLDRAAVFKEKADGLRAMNVPDAVKQFFQEAKPPTGAPYNRLTDEVLAWLQANDQLKRIHVILR